MNNTSLAVKGALAHRLQHHTACNAAPPSMPPMSTYTPQIKENEDQFSIVIFLLNKVFNPSNFLFAFPLSLGTPKSKNIDHFSIVIWALGATFAINKFFDRSNFSFAFPRRQTSLGTPKSKNWDHFSKIIQALRTTFTSFLIRALLLWEKVATGKWWNGMEENDGENSDPLTSLPVDRLMATNCNADRTCQKKHTKLAVTHNFENDLFFLSV